MSKEAGLYPIEIYQGSNLYRSIQLTDDAGEPIVLTGYTAKLQIREDHGGALILELTSSAGIVITAATGTIEISMTSAQTALFNFDAAVYDLFVTLGSVSRCLLYGPVTLIKRVTQ